MAMRLMANSFLRNLQQLHEVQHVEATDHQEGSHDNTAGTIRACRTRHRGALDMGAVRYFAVYRCVWIIHDFYHRTSRAEVNHSINDIQESVSMMREIIEAYP